MRNSLVALLLFAACGGNKAPAQGRPEPVAKAAFDALKVGGIGPLEPHLMTPDEAKKVMGVALDDSAERERLDRLIAQLHDRLDVDWATATPSAPTVKYDAMGQGARLSFEIRSEKGSDTIEIDVTKIGRRFVFQDVRHAKGAALKQAAPEPADDSGDDSGDDQEGC